MEGNSYSLSDVPDAKSAILVVALCGVEPRPGSILIDRKFHEGMTGYVERLDRPFSCLMPRYYAGRSQPGDGHDRGTHAELSYRVNLLEKPLLAAESLRTIERSLDGVALVYMGASEDLNLAVASACRRRDIPYAVVSEYTVQTELDIMRANTLFDRKAAVAGGKNSSA